MRNSIHLMRRSANLVNASARRTFNPSSFFALANQSIIKSSVKSLNVSSNPITLKYSPFSTTAKVFQAIVQEDDVTSNQGTSLINDQYSTLKSFIHPETLQALTKGPFHFEKMSEVQERVLKLLPDLADPFNETEMPDGEGGRDLLVKAKTGTGKTIAFLTPALERRIRAIKEVGEGKFTKPWRTMLQKQKPDSDIDELFQSLDQTGRNRIRKQFSYNTAGMLILSPTRELATQIYNEALKLTKHHRDFGVQLLVGGASRREQLRSWSRSRPDIVVATPGRLLDLLNEEDMVASALSSVQTLIYDEADTLLDMGFRDDMERIVSFLPPPGVRNTMLFSATVSEDIRRIARKSLSKDHRFIDCVPAGEENVHEHIPQFASIVRDGKEQLAQVTRLIALDQLQNPGKSKIVVFAPTTKMVQFLTDQFQTHSDVENTLVSFLPAGRSTQVYELHSRKDSDQRFRTSARFRGDKGGAAVLFTSDVSARGVDYPGTTRVINVGISRDTDQYIHRIGRTGRAGAKGRADIVLQEFESGFVKQSLGHLPVKDELIEETKAKLQDLCERFDKDPVEVVGEEVYEKMQSKIRPIRKTNSKFKEQSMAKDRLARFQSDLSTKLSDDALMKQVEARRLENDPETVEEVFMSQLGFYAGTARDIGTKIEKIVNGLKQWAVSSGDLPREPYISPMLMQKMGIKNNRSSSTQKGSRFGSPSDRERFSSGGRGRFSNEGGRGSFGKSSRGGRDFDNSFSRGGSSSRRGNQDGFF